MGPRLIVMLVVFSSSAWGCPENAVEGLDGGSAVDTGVHDGGVVVETDPILERTPDIRFGCSVSTPTINYSPLYFGSTGVGLATIESGIFVARTESMPNDPGGFLMSTLEPDGDAIATWAISGTNAANVTSPLLVKSAGGGMGLFFIESGQIKYQLINTAGSPQRAPQIVAQAADPSIRLSVAHSGNIFGVVTNTPVGQQSSELTFTAINNEGTVVVPSKRIAANTASNYLLYAAIAPAAGGDGFAVIWTGRVGQRTQMFFAKIDLDGTISIGPKQLTDGENAGSSFTFGAASVTLLEDPGNGYFAAWPEGSGGDFNSGAPSGAYSIIRVGRLGLGGDLREPAAAVRARVDDIDQIEPQLTWFEDVLALSFSTGSHIYICAGCVPDNKIELVLIDPEALVPVSNVVELAPSGLGGFLRRNMTVSGQDILSFFQITFHVHSESGFGAFRCAP